MRRLIITVLCSVFCLGHLSTCNLAPSVSVADQIAAKVHEGGSKVIRLYDLTDFQWKRAFVFGPYTPDEQVQEALGFSWPEVAKFNLSMSDTFWLLVFTEGGQVVKVKELQRKDVAFTPQSLSRGFSVNEAVFAVSGKELSPHQSGGGGQQ